jgi:hypothetical protein
LGAAWSHGIYGDGAFLFVLFDIPGKNDAAINAEERMATLLQKPNLKCSSSAVTAMMTAKKTTPRRIVFTPFDTSRSMPGEKARNCHGSQLPPREAAGACMARIFPAKSRSARVSFPLPVGGVTGN